MATGGRVPSLDFLKKCKDICDDNGAKMHLDAARVFNACVFL